LADLGLTDNNQASGICFSDMPFHVMEYGFCMRIGVFQHGWWTDACNAARHEVIPLPIAARPSGNAYAANLAGRLAHAPTVLTALSNSRPDFLLDNGGTGLVFVADTTADSPRVQLAHEVAGLPLCSHFIDPMTTTLQGLDFHTLWQALQSRTWVKAVWDKAHAVELQRLGVPQVMHLPMAAPNRVYDRTPLDAKKCRSVISFVGGQNSSYFRGGAMTPTATLLAGTLAHCYKSEQPSATFYDIYHDVYGFAPTALGGDVLSQSRNAQEYFNAKLFYHATLCIRNRDRFVILLKRRLGRQFEIIGKGWDTAYGLEVSPPIPSGDPYFQHFRDTAINLNFVNGNAETGLNMRHFEITAAGGFMLCHEHPELADCFEIGKECAVFSSASDLVAKIEYYLSHAEERARIALAGQRRTLSQHLYSHRLQRLLGMIAPQPIPVTYATTDWKDDLRSVVAEPDVILDCGANVGQMAAALRAQYPKAEIYSFEPVSSVYEELSRRCKEIRAVPVHAAVSDHTGKATINLTASSEAHSLLSYQEGNPCAQWTWVKGQEEVNVVALDDWSDQKGVSPDRVHILKLDIQGAELLALYGARKLLRTVKAIFLEVCFVPMYKDAPLFAEVDQFLREAGFRRHAVYPSDQPHNWGDALYVKN
jgi:FkbM family methyltransferase